MNREWWCRFFSVCFECGWVSSQRGRSDRGCLFGAYFDQEIVRKVRVRQGTGDVFGGLAKLGVIIVEYFFLLVAVVVITDNYSSDLLRVVV